MMYGVIYVIEFGREYMRESDIHLVAFEFGRAVDINHQ